MCSTRSTRYVMHASGCLLEIQTKVGFYYPIASKYRKVHLQTCSTTSQLPGVLFLSSCLSCKAGLLPCPATLCFGPALQHCPSALRCNTFLLLNHRSAGVAAAGQGQLLLGAGSSIEHQVLATCRSCRRVCNRLPRLMCCMNSTLFCCGL